MFSFGWIDGFRILMGWWDGFRPLLDVLPF